MSKKYIIIMSTFNPGIIHTHKLLISNTNLDFNIFRIKKHSLEIYYKYV